MKALNKKILTGTILASFVVGSFGIIHNQAYADTAGAASVQSMDGTKNQSGFPGRGSDKNGGGNQGGNVVKETATLLGVDQTTIMDALKEGTTLLQFAKDKGLTEDDYLLRLTDAMTAAIDAELAAGTITQEQADQQKSGLSNRLQQQIGNKVGGNQPPSADSGTTKPQKNDSDTKKESTPTVTDSTYSQNSHPNTDLIDIDGHWAVTYIKDLVAKGILQGDDNKRFNPDTTVTREELATMVAKSFNITSTSTSASTSEPNFSDVPNNRWSYSNIEATKDYFDTQTDKNGKLNFKPTEASKREDVAVTLVKALLKKNASMSLMDATAADELLQTKFKDYDSIPVSLRPYVATAVQSNLIQGDDQGNFAPEKTITRAEVATLLDRLLSSN